MRTTLPVFSGGPLRPSLRFGEHDQSNTSKSGAFHADKTPADETSTEETPNDATRLGDVFNSSTVSSDRHLPPSSTDANGDPKRTPRPRRRLYQALLGAAAVAVGVTSGIVASAGNVQPAAEAAGDAHSFVAAMRDQAGSPPPGTDAPNASPWNEESGSPAQSGLTRTTSPDASEPTGGSDSRDDAGPESPGSSQDSGRPPASEEGPDQDAPSGETQGNPEAGGAVASTPSMTPPSPAPASPAPVQAGNNPSGELPPPQAPAGFTRVFTGTFPQDVPVGQFRQVYGHDWDNYVSEAGDEGSMDTSRHGMYDPDKVLSVRNGVLHIDMHTEDGKPRVAAPIPNSAKAQTYGRYTVRFRIDAPQDSRYKIAFLLWPSGKDGQGEIDGPEIDPAGTQVGGFHHPTNNGNQFAFSSEASSHEWHTMTLEWTPGKVRMLLDNQPMQNDQGGTEATVGVPANPMDWILQSETTLRRTDGSDTNGDPRQAPSNVYLMPTPGERADVQVAWATYDKYDQK